MRRLLLLPRPAKVAINLVLSGAVIAYLVWQVDLGSVVDHVRGANGLPLLGAIGLYLASTWGMAWRWQLLLDARALHEPLRWLTGLYFVGYAAGQLLPTGLGGDAWRIVEHSRRRPGRGGEVAAAVLLERVIGAAGTLVLVAIGLVAAIGRYDGVQFLVWVELVSVALVGAGLFLLFSVRVRRRLGWLRGVTAHLRIEGHARSLYEAMHSYRERPRVVGAVMGATVVFQLMRILAIWLCAEAVGLSLSPLVFVILGPLLFLVMMIPFTINGLGVREAFFVVFLARFEIAADPAFAVGFLFFTVTIATALPGALILLWRGARPAFFRTRAARS
jgi:glycosyltransferase 2 family protein